MRWSRSALSVLLSLAVFAVLAFFLSRLGLAQADQMASVLGLFVGIGSAAAAVVAIRQARPGARGPAGGSRRLPTAWGPRQVSEELTRLLSATRRAADSLPNPLLGERRTEVSTVYVQQRVEQPRRPRPRRRHLDEKQLFLPFDQQPRVIPVRRPFAKAFDQHRHMLLEGGPGTGKTTTARQVCRQLADAWLRADPAAREMTGKPLLPILVSARALAEHLTLRWPEAVALAARAELGATARFDVPPELLEGPVDGVPWLVVVDGLDEVPGDERDALLTRLAAHTSATDGTYRLLITTRPLAGHATAVLGSGMVGHYTLVPFDAPALAEFARRWLTDEDGVTDDGLAAGFLAEVAASGLEEIAAIPLLATIAIGVYESGQQYALPRNRYDLYESYLSRLRHSGRQRRADARAELAETLSGEPDGPAVAAGLYERLDEVVEGLALVRVSGRAPLLPAALEQLRQAGVPAGEPAPLDWRYHVVEALTTTGLISRRGVEFDFIHLSFAEHLAARAHARDLPGRFDPADDRWRDWIYRAISDDPVAMRVLAAWTRDHPAGELVDWLQSGLTAHRRLSERLIAEGTEVTAEQLDRCLESFEGAVALLRRFPVDDRLLEWLRARLDRATLPVSDQIHHARLLADRDPSYRPRAIERITAILLRTPLVADLLTAAEALHQLSSGRNDGAVSALAAVMADTGRSDDDRVSVAVSLLALNGAERHGAIDLLVAILRDERAEPWARRTAAEALAEADGDRRAEIVDQMTAVLHDPRTVRYTGVAVAETLIAVAPDRSDEATEYLWATLTDRLSERELITEAMRVLTGLGSHTHRRLSDELLQIAERPETEPYLRSTIGKVLSGLGDQALARAVELMCGERLFEWAARPAASGTDWGSITMEPDVRELLVARLSAAANGAAGTRMGRLGLLFDLATMDPVHQSDAAAALRLLTNPPLSNDTLHMALGCLGSLSPADALPLAKRLVLLAIDEDVDHPLPHLIVHSVDSVVPDHHAEASADSVLTLRDSLGSPVRRQIAALSLASDVAHRPEAVRYLADSLTNRRLPSSDRGRLVASTRQYAVGEPRITDAYRSFLLDPTAVTWLRITVAHALLTSVPDGRVIAIPALRAIADDRLTFPDARSHAIRTLRAMKVATSEQADAAEQVVAGDVYLPVATRAYAYLRLAETGGMALDKVVDRLTALLAAGYGTFNERLEAAMDAATRSTPAVRLSIVAALNRTGWRSAQTGDEAPSSYAAARLVQLLGPSASEAIGYVAWSAEAATDASGWEYQTGLLGVLDQTTRQRLLTIEDPGKAHPTAVDRLLRTARRLVLLAPDRRPEAAAALRQLLGRPDLRPDQRLEAVWQLSKLDIDDVAHAAHLLNATIREGARDLDPLDAAALLYRDFISERPAAGAYLRAVAADQDESHTRRRAACDVLLDSGGRRALRTAADVLREFLTDPRLGLDERLLAGQRLAEICAGAYDDVRDVFLSMHPPQPAGRVRIATALLTLDAADQAAIDRLCEIAGDPQTPARACREAARFLSGDVPLYRRALVPVLLGRISGGPTPADAVWLHQCLATVLPEAVPSSVAALQRLAAAGEALVRIEAATALLPFGTAEIGARQVLWEILNCAEVPGHLRVLAGRRLVTRPGALAGALHDTLLALPGSTDDQIRAALVLLGYPGPPSDRATAALRTLLARADVAAHLRLTAAEALAGQDDPDGQACAIAVFAEAGADASLHPWLRFRAIAWLGRHDGRRTNEAFDRLQEFLICPDADLEQRRWAAEALGDLDGMQRRVARDALLRHDGDALDDRARRRLRRSAATI